MAAHKSYSLTQHKRHRLWPAFISSVSLRPNQGTRLLLYTAQGLSTVQYLSPIDGTLSSLQTTNTHHKVVSKILRARGASMAIKRRKRPARCPAPFAPAQRFECKPYFSLKTRRKKQSAKSVHTNEPSIVPTNNVRGRGGAESRNRKKKKANTTKQSY